MKGPRRLTVVSMARVGDIESMSVYEILYGTHLYGEGKGDSLS